MELVVLKFGGGLITDKSKLCTPNHANIKALCKTVENIHSTGKYKIVIIHGAGGFGHLKAKAWKLDQGKQVDCFSPACDRMGLQSQEEAVKSVQIDMICLNKLILSNLCEVPTRTFSPHLWASGTGRSFSGSLEKFYGTDDEVVITHGDIVPVAGQKRFGVLSGDDIAVRIILEADRKRFSNVHMVFAMTGADGLLSRPPGDPRSELIPQWHPGDETAVLCHDTNVDVTGGIQLKLKCAAEMCGRTDNIWIVNGNFPSRIIDALSGSAIGTHIFQL